MKTLIAIAGLAALGAAQGERKMPAGFEQVARMEGTWESSDGAKVTYKVASGGSVVLETLVHGKSGEMLTVYHADGDDLVMTHYCTMGNQPHMKAEKPAGAGTIRFVCSGGTNLKCSIDPHMHALTMTFADPDHVKEEWTMFEGGKEKMTATFNLVRKKE